MATLRRTTILLAILAAALFLLILPPERIWPGSLPYASFDGAFTGEPVAIPMAATSIGGDSVPLRVEISMPSGAAEIRLAGRDGEASLFTMGRGSWRHDLAADETLILDPRGFNGSYSVQLGNPFHPLAPLPRIIVLGGIVLVVALALVRPLLPGATPRLPGRDAQRPDARKRVIVGAIMLASYALYSIVHELGHVVFGLLAGGELERVVWTTWTFEEPHVEFGALPPGWGAAWMAAGGMILPTLAGLTLVDLWLRYRQRLPFLASALVVVPGISLLLGNLGGPLEGMRYVAGGGTPHMIPLGIQLGLGVLGTALFACLPLVLTVAAYVLVYRALRTPGTGDSGT